MVSILLDFNVNFLKTNDHAFKLVKNEKYLVQENVALCHLVSVAYMKLTNQSKHATEEKLVQAVKLLSQRFKIFVKILEFHFRKHIFKSQEKSENGSISGITLGQYKFGSFNGASRTTNTRKNS